MTMVELTPMDILSRVVHGAAKPLAHFLEDALTQCIGANYISVVNRLLRLDGSNQKQPNPPVDSLFRLDLLSLLKLVDQCFFLPKNDTFLETEWKEEFRSLFGVPKGSESNHKTAQNIQNLVIAGVRKARNDDYAHLEAGRTVSVRTVKSDLHKILDLYQGHLYHIAVNTPKMFSLETVSQLSEYVEVVEYYLRLLEKSSTSNTIEAKPSPGVASNTNVRSHPRRLYWMAALTGVAAAFVTIAYVIWIQPANERIMLIGLCGPIEGQDQAKVTLLLDSLAQANDVSTVMVLTKGYVDALVLNTKSDAIGWIDTLVQKTKHIPRVASLSDSKDLFDKVVNRATTLLSEKKDQIVVVGTIGSHGSWLRKVRNSSDSRDTVRIIQSGSEKLWEQGKLPAMLLVAPGKWTTADSAIYSAFAQSNIAVKRIW